MVTVGLLHPGAMGAAIGASLRAEDVIWASEGRSPASRARAKGAGLRDVGSLAALVAGADIVVSVCPPEAAVAVAESVAGHAFTGTYVDANAVAPATAHAVQEHVTRGGASYVDGGIIGGPDAPRLFLAGSGAAMVADLFGPPVDVVVLEQGGYAASALKMLYAGWTKGTAALLLALVAAARRFGLQVPLQDEWARSQPTLAGRVEASVSSSRKAWRWDGEMHEIARALADGGLPAGFHLGAADVFARLHSLKDAPAITLDDVVGLLLEARPDRA